MTAAIHWTPELNRALAEMANAGASQREMAHKMGFGEATIQRQVYKLRQEGLITFHRGPGGIGGVRPAPKPQAVIVNGRKCLSCSRVFESEGRHNRICLLCKETDAWRSGCSYGVAA